MLGRTVILVSHHVQLCVKGADYIVALDNGRIIFEGSKDTFMKSEVIRTLTQTTQNDDQAGIEAEKEALEHAEEEVISSTKASSSAATTAVPSIKQNKKPARKLVEEEKRAVGRIGRDIWETYIRACGNIWYWVPFLIIFLVTTISPVLENSWLR